MDFLRLFRSSSSVVPTSSREAEGSPVPRRGGGGLPLVSLTAGGAGQSLSVSTALRCVQLISETVASLPLRVMVRRGAIYQPETGSPLSWALEYEPNEETTAFELIQMAVQSILLHGNAYIVPTFGSDGTRLRLCTPGAAAYDPYADTYDISDTLQGINGRYTGREVIHLRGLTLDGKTGMSVLSFARKSLDIAARGAAEQEKRFANGGTVRGIISNVVERAAYGENQPEQLSDAAAYMEERLEAGDRIVAQPGDGHFTQLTMNSADMQFLESRKFEVREICRFFGVHPSFVFDDTSNNYKSAETANAAFLTNTLNPLLRKIELEFTRKLFPGKARKGECRVMFDREALFAMDLDSRHRQQKARLELGTATVNDLRREENRPAVEGGDTALISANLRPITETITQQTDNDHATE
ncbi:MAG: phage portal protein [Pseudoflavonifractor sp.]|nr:phage portal protein [Alloprevotella sp.]MCM1117633.1 phage portal protein [Pseudoflavonifractor sp.]